MINQMATRETEEIKHKMKSNAVERTRIDLVSTHNPSTVMVREVVAAMWLTIQTSMNAAIIHS